MKMALNILKVFFLSCFFFFWKEKETSFLSPPALQGIKLDVKMTDFKDCQNNEFTS